MDPGDADRYLDQFRGGGRVCLGLPAVPLDEWKNRPEVQMREELEALADLGRTPPKNATPARGRGNAT